MNFRDMFKNYGFKGFFATKNLIIKVYFPIYFGNFSQ